MPLPPTVRKMKGDLTRTAQRPANLAGRFVLWTDVQWTRRKRYFVIEGPEGETLYSSTRFADCVAWLDGEEISQYVVATPTASFDISVLGVIYDRKD